jgi:phospholipid/cholesterol/gamma-HCH transport system substrate-binding protein
VAFSLMEKKALTGLAGIAVFVGFSIWEIGRRNFWFEIKNTYHTHVKNADGLRIGGVVSIAGLRVGEITAMDVDQDNQIRITIEVRRDMAPKIRADSEAVFVRTFVIGEKRIDITPGTEAASLVAEGGVLPGKDSADIADFMSGRKLAELMAQVESLIGGLNNAVGGMNEIFGKYKTGEFNQMIKLAEPALQNLVKLSEDALVITKDLKKSSKVIPSLLANGNEMFAAANEDLFKTHVMRDTFAGAKRDMFDNGLLRQTMQSVDGVMRPTTKLVGVLAEKEQLFKQLLGNLEDLSKDLQQEPRYGKKLLVMIDELTITLKALQKTWLLEDQADETRKAEQKKRAKEKSKEQKKKKAPTSPPVAE